MVRKGVKGLVLKKNATGQYEEKVKVVPKVAGFGYAGSISADHTKIMITFENTWYEYSINVDTNTSSQIATGTLGSNITGIKYVYNDKMFYYRDGNNNILKIMLENGREESVGISANTNAVIRIPRQFEIMFY